MGIKERLLEKCSVESNGCWLFTGYNDELGYGIIAYKGSANKAHRISWLVHNGNIPQGKNVLHKCDVRNCINPEHLFIGTQADNVNDMIAKGRKHTMKGVTHPGCRLSEANIGEIKRLLTEGKKQAWIARKFKTTDQNIYRIKTGKTWGHLV